MMLFHSLVALSFLFVAPFSVGAGIPNLRMSGEKSIYNNITLEDVRRNLIELDPKKLELDREARMERQRARRERAREKIASIKPDMSSMQRLTKEELEKASEEDHPWVRRAGWSYSSNYDPYNFAGLVDPSQSYKWSQAYRMLGGFVDCDHKKVSNNNHKSQDQNQNEDEGNTGCSRWMMWAAVS